MIRSYKYRMYPTSQQASLLGEMLVDFCEIYNAALQQRMEAYRRQKKSISFYSQSAEMKLVRVENPHIKRWSASGLEQVLRRLDQTYASFFRRGGGYPRFRASSRFHSARFKLGDGLTLKSDKRIGVVGIPGRISVVWHRDLPPHAKIKAAMISRQQGKWHVIFSVEADFTETRGTGTVGIDLGLNSLIATSDGETVEMPRFARKAQKAQRRRQRALARCQKGSKRRLKAKARLAAGSAKIARQRRDHLHKISRSLVSRYQGVALENLNMAGLKRGILARSVHDASWSTLVDLISYKAASAGAEVRLVDPRGTSQTCPACGTIKAKTLSVRSHRCECGAVIDRDVAAAMVVHQRAFGSGSEHGPQTLTGRVAA